jgi:hypothetical protein
MGFHVRQVQPGSDDNACSVGRRSVARSKQVQASQNTEQYRQKKTCHPHETNDWVEWRRLAHYRDDGGATS